MRSGCSPSAESIGTSARISVKICVRAVLATGQPETPGGSPVLDSLLTLPGDRTYTVDRRGGLTRGEWRAQFDRIRSDLAEERAALESAEQRMDQAAERGAWKVAPPIPGQNAANPGETTLDFKTRQEIRRHRDEITRLESRLKDLEIKANLAGVPEAWRS